MNRKFAFVFVLPLFFLLSSCGLVSGAAAGAGGGFGLTKLLGGNNKTAAAVGVGGAVVGALLGHFLVDLPEAERKEWAELDRCSVRVGEAETVRHQDGSSTVTQQFYYRPGAGHQGECYDGIFDYSAGGLNKAPKRTGAKIDNWRPAPPELVAQFRDVPQDNLAKVNAPGQAVLGKK